MSNAVLSVFNTYSDASNYDKLSLKFALTTGVSAQLVASTAGTGTDNINVVLTPAGTGALIAGPPPDGGVTGGNARGQYAVDLTFEIGAAVSVASGQYSNRLNSSRTRSGGIASCSVGGYANDIVSQYCSALGGDFNTGGGAYGTCIGSYSNVVLYGRFAQAAGRFFVGGDAQTSVLTARRQTTTDVANQELFLDGAGGTYRAILANNTTWAFRVLLTARRTDADGENAMYLFEGAIKRDANAASTAIVGAVTKTVLAEDTIAWDANVVADAGNGALSVQVTGENFKTINWVARIELAETTG